MHTFEKAFFDSLMALENSVPERIWQISGQTFSLRLWAAATGHRSRKQKLGLEESGIQRSSAKRLSSGSTTGIKPSIQANKN